MYLPVSELQQYKGQWMCPYCLMDSRDEDRRIMKGPDDHYKGISVHEKCERCGRTLSVVYYYAGRRLCEVCVEDAKNEWGDVGGERPPMSMLRVGRGAAKRSAMMAFFHALFSEILVRIGLKRREKKKMKEKQGEIVAIRPKIKKFVPLAKPMREGAMGKKEEAKKEGKAKEKKKTKKKKKVSEEEKEEKKEKFGVFKDE
jgi:hypothetical protein